RIGGDEFAVALPETTAEAAPATTGQMLERLRLVTAGLAGGASAGVVTVETGRVGVAALLADADRHLYQAKEEGKGSFRHAVAPDPASRHLLSRSRQLIGDHDVD
ncbi:MAG: diguanylate cyclase domain-containing protein, partial [Acidimicrobiia bacterium]